MDDDLAIKLDRERMEFMRREDTQKHQHKLEIARYAAENSSRACGPAAQRLSALCVLGAGWSTRSVR